MLVVCSYTAIGALEIIRGPQTIFNATVGGSASFECIINDEYYIPRWNIGGRDYDVTTLPIGHYYEQESYSKILTVRPVLQLMNNTCFYCYLSLPGGRQESSRAKLIIYSDPSSFNSRSTPTETTISRQRSTAISIQIQTLAKESKQRSAPGTDTATTQKQ